MPPALAMKQLFRDRLPGRRVERRAGAPPISKPPVRLANVAHAAIARLHEIQTRPSPSEDHRIDEVIAYLQPRPISSVGLRDIPNPPLTAHRVQSEDWRGSLSDSGDDAGRGDQRHRWLR